jgi:leishmanolysin-like peptidase
MLSLLGSCILAAPAPPKAIVLMLGDDYGYNNVGFAHGPTGADYPQGGANPEMRTPHMDALAATGIVLDRFYTYKYCSPTRSSLMSGRLPTRVNQNNKNNDIEATSGVDLRFTMLPAKMKEAGFATAFVGKSHLGARSPANLPINRGFDYHFGFLKGGEKHYTQGSSSSHYALHDHNGVVDLWSNDALSNETGQYSGYLYAHKAVGVVENFTRTVARFAAEGRASAAPKGLFMYLAWHNTHTPLECPPEWMYPSLPAYNNSASSRMVYNCMARILDDGVGNVTAALRNAGLWDSTLLFFAGDNGGWVGNTGSNNYPLRGSKTSDFEGGVRVVSWLAGGYLPANVRGGVHSGYISIADWYGTLCNLVGVDAADDVAGLPPVESNDFWPSIITPNATTSGRDEIFLAWSCAPPSSDVTGCDPRAVSIYNSSGDPTAGVNKGDMAYIAKNWKVVIGNQNGRGCVTSESGSDRSRAASVRCVARVALRAPPFYAMPSAPPPPPRPAFLPHAHPP